MVNETLDAVFDSTPVDVLLITLALLGAIS